MSTFLWLLGGPFQLAGIMAMVFVGIDGWYALMEREGLL